MRDNKCRTGIMETYWCCEKNSIIDNYLNPDFNPALVPCRMKKNGPSRRI